MIQVIKLENDEELDLDSLGRNVLNDPELAEQISKIVDDVRENGDEALKKYTEQFDSVKLGTFIINPQLIEKATSLIDRSAVESMQRAAGAIFEYYKDMLPVSTIKNKVDGSFCASMTRPLTTVGIYVPGGKAGYPSTVLMNAIPARVAGVERVIIVTPPNEKGAINPSLLVAAKLAGVTEIYAVGGAQAIAALAYGTDSIPKVDKIIGPGNSYVAMAKRIVSTDVAVDKDAGPSEVLVLADDTSSPELVAADLLAQAEHDTEARCYLVTTDSELPDKVFAEIEQQLAESYVEDKAAVLETLQENGLVVVCETLSAAINTVNGIAPEHVEILMDQAMDILGLIDNAGAIFVGSWTPVAVGDYIAGPSHTLPTGGSARFAGPLTLEDFIKRTNVIYYTSVALTNSIQDVRNIAQLEGFELHARSVELRDKILRGELES